MSILYSMLEASHHKEHSSARDNKQTWSPWKKERKIWFQNQKINILCFVSMTSQHREHV